MNAAFIISLSILAVVSESTFAGSPLPDALGVPWAARDTPIRWEASLDKLPSSAAVYRVVSVPFPATVLSNLLLLAGLTEKDRGKPTWDGARPEDLWFTDSEGNRTLGVHTQTGLFSTFHHGVIAL